jgi:hypothetical protein
MTENKLFRKIDFGNLANNKNTLMEARNRRNRNKSSSLCSKGIKDCMGSVRRAKNLTNKFYDDVLDKYSTNT